MKLAFESTGFRRLLDSLKTELAQDYLTDVAEHLEELRFRRGTLMTARIGPGNKGGGYALRRLEDKKLSWWQQLFASRPRDVYTFALHPRDDSGARALSEIRDDGISAAASIMAGVAEHVLAFFQQLRTELAFYLGCLNLEERLTGLQEGICFPLVEEMEGRRHSAKGLYDVCLALNMGRKVVDNDFDDEGQGLMIITGANQGGKSTFLRGIGLAQLMMQAGMFVPAERFSAGLCRSLFTHFKREEDAGMKSGKFDEEMSRMSEIADHVTRDGIGLFNESFAATNEREGSEIARQIVAGLREKGVRIFFVTHLYAFARSFWEHNRDMAVFLRAERREDMQRTFKVVTGEPLPTSFALDIYKRLFPDDTLTGTSAT
ncbi:MutS-related protein [Puia sp. P3]|uniref:MutS-related protein n=1 Tax=Puia sp. P3 TaxID=3423952 RepID=UPI003D67E0FD